MTGSAATRDLTRGPLGAAIFVLDVPIVLEMVFGVTGAVVATTVARAAGLLCQLEKGFGLLLSLRFHLG